MISQLDEAERPTDVAAAPYERRDTPMPWSHARPTSRFAAFDTFPAMTHGLVALAAIWAGLAIFVSAFVFPIDTSFAKITLAVVGGWMLAAATAYVVADAPNRAQETAPGFA